MAVVIANARQTVPAPARTARRFGVFSVVDPVDGAESHWMLGGLTADAEDCSKPLTGTILCGPTAPKTARSWYSDAIGDPWLTYMYETCKTVGRVGEASSKLRTRFLASEQSAVESGLEAALLATSTSVGTATSMAQAIGTLEADAGANFGGQIIVWLPFVLGEQAAKENLLIRVDGHLETVGGSLVVIGNFPTAGGATKVAYGTGALSLFRSPLVESGPFLGANLQNDYYTLIERAYGVLADCWRAKVTATISADPTGGPGGGEGATSLDEGASMSAAALGIECGQSNADTAAALVVAGVVANPTRNWGAGSCASVDCGGDVDREVRWDGSTWVGC